MQKELTYILCGLFTLGLGACSSPAKRKAEVPPLAVRTLVVGASQEQAVSSRYVGTIEAIHEAPLSMQTPGRVLAVNCQDGSRVRKGQTLLSIDNTQAVNALRSAEAALRQAQDGYDRVKQVHEKGAVTDQQMVEIESKLSQAKALHDAAQRQVNECELKAPFDGVVSGLDIQIGQTTIPGVRLLTLLDVSAYAVRFTVPEAEISALEVGQKGQMECVAVDSVLPCRITEKGLQANALAHTYEVKAAITGGRDILRPGMVCKVQITNATANANANAPIIIPAKCILLKPEGHTVWLKENGKAVRRSITLGGYQANGVLVTAGLQPGDSLITDGYQKLYNDCHVISLDQ